MKFFPTVTAIACLCFGLLLCAGVDQAQAYCVYNHTKEIIHVAGESCRRCYEGFIKAGGKGCCPGGAKGCRGETWITVLTGADCPVYAAESGYLSFHCGKQVEAHGWASIYPDRKCVVKNAKGEVTWEGKMKEGCGPKDD